MADKGVKVQGLHETEKQASDAMQAILNSEQERSHELQEEVKEVDEERAKWKNKYVRLYRCIHRYLDMYVWLSIQTRHDVMQRA